MASHHYEFDVIGRPQAQGSTRSFVVKKGGQYTGRTVTTSDNPTLGEWKDAIAGAAMSARGDRALFYGPVRVVLRFYFIRPAGHYGSGRNVSKLRPAAPPLPAVKPDLDKLIRAVLDGCTDTVWRDDAQVTSVLAHKEYGPTPGVHVAVTELVRVAA